MDDSKTLSFKSLLTRLSTTNVDSAEKYEELRIKISRILQWKGVPDSHVDALTDDVLDRVGHKISQGITVANIDSYVATVSRYVWLEYCRKRKEFEIDDNAPEPSYTPDIDEEELNDVRLRCLRKCIADTPETDGDRHLILEYYDSRTEKNKDVRRRLAVTFGVSVNSLRVRACRARFKLEKCINNCVQKVMKPSGVDAKGLEGT